MNQRDAQPSIQQSPPHVESTSGARLVKAGMGLVLVIAGSVFVVGLWHSYQRAAETRKWIATPCIIVTSQILSERHTPNSPMGYRAGVRYHYTFDGKKYSSERIERTEGMSPNIDKAAALVQEHPVGQATTCFVNPAQPDFAILKLSTMAALYTMWFPLLFVVGGTGMIVSAFFTRRTDHS